MKGVVLAGGTGSRLNLLTRVTNKHLLLYDKPMVYYPIQTLVNDGFRRSFSSLAERMPEIFCVFLATDATSG